MDFHYWQVYFESNKKHFSGFGPGADEQLSPDEQVLIRSSLQQFQRGEYSEGKHLIKDAGSFPDPDYLPAIRLFVREEQMHAKVLGDFMDHYSIARIRGHWVDAVFRKLRQLSGIENTVAVLLTAEIISKVYYDALGKATGSGWLKAICRQILLDEEQHLGFQCYTLRSLYRKKQSGAKLVFKLMYATLLLGTMQVVWACHYRVLKKGGYSRRRFQQAVWRIYQVCIVDISEQKRRQVFPEILFP